MEISCDILRGFTYVCYRRSRFGGLANDRANLLNGPANPADKALLEQRFQQNIPDPHSRRLRRDIFVRIAGYENNRCGYVAVTQTAGRISRKLGWKGR